MSDPDLWVGVWREYDPHTRKRYPIEPKPEWLLRSEWENMIFGSRAAFIAALRKAMDAGIAEGRELQSIKPCDPGHD